MANDRSNTIAHICNVHFKFPKSKKLQGNKKAQGRKAERLQAIAYLEEVTN